MIRKYIRKDLLDFKPYNAPNKDYDIKIDANENPYNHSEEVLKKAQTLLENKDFLTRYPDTDHHRLREAIAEVYELDKRNVTCGVGSDQLIDYIIKTFIEPGDKILVPDPSFSMYDITNTLNHGITISYDLEADFSYNKDTLLKMVQEYQPKIVFICTPNNPTGSSIPKESLIEILENIPCPVVVDEAYSEFVKDSIVDRIHDFPQLIVLRTFSKAYGLAGLRIGYALASEEMIEALNKVKAPYNLSSFSQEIACLVLEHRVYYDEMIQRMNEGNNALQEALKKLEFMEAVYPSVANFILIKVKDLAVASYLESHKILVRAYGTTGRLANCIRISIGTEQENEKLVNLLKEYEASLNG